MRFRKLPGLIAGALVGGALVVPAFVAPAQAAPTSDTVSTPMACAYGSFTIQYPAEIELAVDGLAVTATLSDIPPTGMPAFLTVTGADAVVSATVDGEAVTLSGTETYATPRTGNPAIALPDVSGTRAATAALGDFSISTVAVTMWVKAAPMAPPGPQNMTCTAIPAKTVTDTQALTCVFQDFGIAYSAELSANVYGTSVTGTLAQSFAPGMPAFVTVSKMVVNLNANVDSTPVTLTGQATYAPARPGNTSFAIPALTGTRTGILSPNGIDITGMTITITAMGGDNVINCTPTVAPAATVTTLTATATGRAVKLAATVAPAAAGKIEFKDGATSLGQVVVAAGAAKLDLTAVALGAHSYTATFVPTNALSYAGSTSSAQAVTISDPVVTPPVVTPPVVTPPGPSQACTDAGVAVTNAQAALTAATAKDKKAKAAVKKAKATVKKLTKAKASKAKIKAAKAKLKKARAAAIKATKALNAAKAAFNAAKAAQSAKC